jgi:hypothetical protein
MERILKILDDLDDLLANLLHYSPKVMTTVLLLVVFAAVVTALFVYGPPDLLAAD